MSVSGVLSCRLPAPYSSEYASIVGRPAALLNGHFEHPAQYMLAIQKSLMRRMP